MKKDLTLEDVYNELDEELYNCKEIEDFEEILSEFGKVTVTDDKIDDTIDDCDTENNYMMLRCYDVETKLGTLYVDMYYGNNTLKIYYYTIHWD